METEVKLRIIENILLYIFKPMEDKHRLALVAACEAVNDVGFKHRSQYYRYGNTKSTTPDYKLPKLTGEAGDLWDKHNKWYEAACRDREGIKWFLLEMVTKAPDFYSFFALLPYSIREYTGVDNPYSAVPSGISMSEKAITAWQDKKRARYALIDAALLKRTLLTQ